MATVLKDIPTALLTPEEVEAVANKEFDYADRERVSIRAAKLKLRQDFNDDLNRRNLSEINRIFGTTFEIKDPAYRPGQLTETPTFGFKEKVFEIAKAGHRGLGSLVKLPGVALKAIGEAGLTRKEIDELRKSPYKHHNLQAAFAESPSGKTYRATSDMLRRAGNKYIEFVNGLSFEESPESRAVRQQSFRSAPFYRTAIAVGESAPSYGTAIAATLTSGNPNIGLLVLGTTTASSSYEDLRGQGVDPDLALLGAVAEGSIEMITEKVPMDMLMRSGGRPLLIRALRIGTAESFQELFAQLGQNYVDAVVKDIDPDDRSTVIAAANQEWAIITQGWEDAMAAGFAMGAGASMFAPAPFRGRTAEQLREQYGVYPRNTDELVNMIEKIRQDVKAVEVEKPAEEVEEPQVVEGEVASEARLRALQSKIGDENNINIIIQDNGKTLLVDFIRKAKDSKKTSTEILSIIEDEAREIGAEKIRGEVIGEAKRRLFLKGGFKVVDEIGDNEFILEKEVLVPTEAKPPVTEPADIPSPAEARVQPLPEPVKKSLIDNLTPKEQDELEVLEKQFHDKIRNQLNIGLDPEMFLLATKIGTLYVKAGYRAFGEWAAQVRTRVGDISDHALKTVYASLREKFPDLDSDEDISIHEIGEGKIRPRGTSISVMAQAIEDDLVQENKATFDEIPVYRSMNMAEQARRALDLIESDLERAKRVAFYQEPSPPDLFPENVFSALRTYARETADVDLIMDLALNDNVVREHTILGKRIKSLDTDQDTADPVRAIKEVVEVRKERLVTKGKDISALEAKLRDLQGELDRSRTALNAHVKTAKRQYGAKNTLVTQKEYNSILARRKKEAAALKHDPRLGAVYVPTTQDFTDIAKIGLFHLEAMGRDFAKWSYQMTRDFGDWIGPHLQDEYDKALAEAKGKGVAIPESKRLQAKKKRLATGTKKFNERLEQQDLEKIPRIPIELDEEGQKLQNAFDLAREKYKAAQAVANIITEEEVRIIAQLAKDAADRKLVMENSERRQESHPATKTELEYGIALSMFLEYVNDLKAEAKKRTFRQVLKDYLSNPVDFISDFAGSLKAAKASLDNSFHLRQGLPTFLKAITGHVPSAKVWWDTFIKSWKIMWQTLHKQKVMRGLFAEMVSDPDYELLKKSKVALNVIEEEIPVDIPSRIPLLGMLFRMGENAFVGSARYMRYRLAKEYLRVWRKSGKELNKRELESLGRLSNSQTGRGDIASKSQKPGLLNNLFWSPRNLRAYIDILTLHLFDRDFSAFARKQAAINLLHYISGAAMILAMAKWIDDDSVTWDSNSSDFGKIRVGDTRFSVGGGLTVLVVLASRLVSRKFTSATTGKTRSIDTRRFGAIGGKELIFNFMENKFSPAAQLAFSLLDQASFEGDELRIPQMVDDALTPLIIQNVFETGSSDDAANVLAALIAEALGVNVQTFRARRAKTNRRTDI